MNEYLLYTQIILILLVPSIYMLNLHTSLLVGGKATKAFDAFTIILLFLGIAYLIWQGLSKYTIGVLCIAASPLIHSQIFKVCFRAFVKKFGRPPKDVYLNFRSGLFWDRAFAICVSLGCIYISWSLVFYFHWEVIESIKSK
ncbi:hypothetical protein CW740_02585 [Kangiella profundi]|uniref:Uncharacterized protein n=1 Tax=Kangiella profundi TaxID=1561924 RepID=A0A2K9AGU9_9GAMM|nr:hypothetical protein CW740_02585 [Kangiella profundi]